MIVPLQKISVYTYLYTYTYTHTHTHTHIYIYTYIQTEEGNFLLMKWTDIALTWFLVSMIGTCSWKPWTSTKFVRSELTVETLASPKHGKIILKVHVPNKREMWLPCFEKIWPLNGMKMSWYSACLLLLFLFRANGKKGNLNEHSFRHCYGSFFRKRHSESYVITAMFKVPSQQNEAHWQQHFERYPTVLCFTDIDQHAC